MYAPNHKHTLEHLKELRDEVRELHPILNVLFRKLPGIDRVHYNQGANELGADFILFKRDPALRRVTCIGVVVKADSIRQNTTEVERQIKECFIPRKAVSTDEIQIKEVWVVSSQDITRNAREVLARMFADKKVEFIPAQDLAGMIDEFAPDAFVTTSPALQAYAEQILQQLEAEDQRSLVVPGLDAFYVEPIVIRRGVDGYGNAKPSKRIPSLDDLLRLLMSSQLSVVQAGAGGGKSRLARELAKRVFGLGEYSDGELLPVVEHASRFVGDTVSQVAAVRDRLRAAAQSEGRSLIFIDGFDEVELEDAQRSIFVEDLLKGASTAGDVSIVLLSRPFDEATILGGRLLSLDIFRIEPLKGSKALEFLGKVAGQLDVRSKLVSDLKSSMLLRALDGAPIAYMLLGRLIAENQQDLPSNLTELFQKYVELVLGRWEMAKGLRSQQEFEVLNESLTWVSGFMLDNQIPELARSELEDWIRSYCDERGLALNPVGLVDRVCGRNSILYLRVDVGTIGFRHRAFSEFFYAKGLDRKKELHLTPDVFTPYWMNSYYFLAGLKRDCPDYLSSLMLMDVEQESQRLLRILNMGNFLLAGYLTPLSVAEEAVLKAASELADMYVDACDPSSVSQLTQLPTLQLLCAFTAAFRHQYGYRHFRPALEDAIYRIESNGKGEKTAIALFLLDAAYKEAGGSLRFDNLIGEFGDSLPMVVKLGIQHESERMGHMSDRVKKMERNLRRAFRANAGSQAFLHKLYSVPIHKLDKKLI